MHKVFISCSAFRGKDINAVNQLFRDGLKEIYDAIFDIDADPLEVPVDDGWEDGGENALSVV